MTGSGRAREFPSAAGNPYPAAPPAPPPRPGGPGAAAPRPADARPAHARPADACAVGCWGSARAPVADVAVRRAAIGLVLIVRPGPRPALDVPLGLHGFVLGDLIERWRAGLPFPGSGPRTPVPRSRRGRRRSRRARRRQPVAAGGRAAAGLLVAD